MRSLFGPLPLRAVLTVILGCVALGLFFGEFAGSAYRLLCYVLWEPLDGPRNFTIPDLRSTGGILGASGGLAVSLVWCRRMGRARGQSTPAPSVFRGAMLGAALGVLCTLWLHAGLIAAVAMDPDRPYKRLVDMFPLPLGIGLACGAIGGAILGGIGSRLCRRSEECAPAEGATLPSAPESSHA